MSLGSRVYYNLTTLDAIASVGAYMQVEKYHWWVFLHRTNSKLSPPSINL